jgi:hypothetical protein
MPTINLSALAEYRSRTYFTAPGLNLTSVDAAVEFVNQRGFVFFWPIKGVELPSLWAAVAGDRPVADEHDDPGHITWGWKDDTLGKKRWYYGRFLKHRNAMASLQILPYFYALTPNYGEPAEDYLIQYQQGQLRPEAKWVFEALLNEGPMDTLSLRKAAHLSNPESEGRFNRAIDDLQTDFRILPIGIAPVGAWRYAFIYECTHRHHPDLFDQVTNLNLTEADARVEIAAHYFRSVGAARPTDAARLFNWRPPDSQKAFTTLCEQEIIRPASHPQDKTDWLALPDLLE